MWHADQNHRKHVKIIEKRIFASGVSILTFISYSTSHKAGVSTARAIYGAMSKFGGKLNRIAVSCDKKSVCKLMMMDSPWTKPNLSPTSSDNVQSLLHVCSSHWWIHRHKDTIQRHFPGRQNTVPPHSFTSVWWAQSCSATIWQGTTERKNKAFHYIHWVASTMHWGATKHVYPHLTVVLASQS